MLEPWLCRNSRECGLFMPVGKGSTRSDSLPPAGEGVAVGAADPGTNPGHARHTRHANRESHSDRGPRLPYNRRVLAPILAILRLYRLWLAAVAGYLIGSILMADLVSKVANRGKNESIDLRATGSGNPGAANAFANLGKRWGVAVMAGDILKGGAGAQAGRIIVGDTGAYVAATASVVGHCFPAWADFRGGKGAATSAGTTLVCFPSYIPFEALSVGGSFAVSRHAGKATAAGTALFVTLAFAWHRFRLPNAWGTKPTLGLPLYAIVTSAIMGYKFWTAPKHMGDIKDRPIPPG